MNVEYQYTLLIEFSNFLKPLALIAESEAYLRQLFANIGWDLTEIAGLPTDELTEKLQTLADLHADLINLIEEPGKPSQAFLSGVDIVFQILDTINDLHTIFGDAQRPSHFDEVGQDLLEFLTATYLQTQHRVIYHLAVLLAVIRPAEEIPPRDVVVDSTGKVVRYPIAWPKLEFENIPKLFTDPIGLLKAEYFPPGGLSTVEEAQQVADKLFARLGQLLAALDVNAVYGISPNYGLVFDPISQTLGSKMLTVYIAPDTTGHNFGVTLALSSPEAGDGNLGLVIRPFGPQLQFSEAIASWLLELNVTDEVEAFAIGFDGQPTILGAPEVNARLALTKLPEVGNLALLIGNQAGSHLEVTYFQMAIEASLESGSQTYGLGFEIGATALAIADILKLSWEKLNLRFMDGVRFDFSHFLVASELLPDFVLDFDLQLHFQNGQLGAGSRFKLYRPDLGDFLPLNQFYIDNHCLAFQWEEPNLNRWLKRLAADFFDESEPVQSLVTIRAIFGRSVDEIRLDWAVSGGARTFALPGLIQITTPDNGRFSLLLGADSQGLTHLALGFSFAAGTALEISSNFAWGRGDDRELQNDARDAQTSEPVFILTLTAKQTVSLILMEFNLANPSLPKLLRQPENPFEALDFSTPASLCEPVSPFGSFRREDWDLDFDLNLDQFHLPFLKEGGSNQFIEIFKPISFSFDIDPDENLITIPIGVRINIGTLSFTTEFQAEFNWDTFALKVEHNEGIELVTEKEVEEGDFLGLKWALKGTKITDEGNPNKGKYHLFTLVTENNNYQIIQASGAVIELGFTGLSEDPIIFRTSDFKLSPKGISLTTVVDEGPVRLRGLETKFNFAGSGIRLVDNRIQSFTLAGSGPLPPDLVGDATANIFLQFDRRNDGNLTLLQGSAELKGNKLLDCRGTRFQFSVDGLGLHFVNDGRFHLYFTLTGSAQFVLASGDDPEGALALLPKIKIDLVECPLTGDASVIGKHVKFLIELPKPISFNFLGCFELELRAIGFVPQAEVFDGDGAMQLTGQLKFAQGAGDTPDARPDYHILFIGLPERGKLLPRIHFKQLAVNLNIGSAFRLNGGVDFRDDLLEKGFVGEGMIQIQGLPTMAASFGFLRVRRDEVSPWVRAWFIYLEVRRVSFLIPVVQIYIREVGLGFGYRFTLVSIKAADRANDVRQLLAELKKLARTQGDLSKRDRWEVDLEGPGQDPRWTIVLRAMISQTSAAVSPLRYDEVAERNLSCLYLFDAVIAFRSDLTFLMSVRGWLNTNYNDFDSNNQGLRSRPLFIGFVLLSPRQKRFLAHLGTSAEGKVGPHPDLPKFIKEAIEAAQFSATLLIEPGLLHFELGWPNMLRWQGKLGPLQVEFRGGFIFRVSTHELVIGSSFLARGSLNIEAGFSAGVFGVKIRAYAEVAYGARYIGVLDFKNPGAGSALYAGIGLELYCEISIEFWIKFIFVKKTFRFSIGIGFTAALEVGLLGNDLPGIRGTGTISLKAMGRSMRFGITIAVHEDAVFEARRRTERFLQIGLEATDVESLPGLEPAALPETTATSSRALSFAARGEGPRAISAAAQDAFQAPDYSIFVIRAPNEEEEEVCYFVLYPQGERVNADGSVIPEAGFLPSPPNDDVAVTEDFVLQIPAGQASDNFELEHYDPAQNSWQSLTLSDSGPTEIRWQVDWDVVVIEGNEIDEASGELTEVQANLTLKQYLRYAFKWVSSEDEPPPGQVTPVGDPDLPQLEERLADERVHNPSDSAYEAAVRGAVKQFRGSPFFKRDPNYEYDQVLEQAFSADTSIYSADGTIPEDEADHDAMQNNEQADQLRGTIIQDLLSDVKDYAASPDEALAGQSIPFQMGLVFRVRGTRPAWLDQIIADGDSTPTIRQRLGPTSVEPATDGRQIRAFNIQLTAFDQNPPQFERVRYYSDADTIAITWDLSWDRLPAAGCTPCQADPEHHLFHYRVQRRPLNSQERELVYTVKTSEVLHRDLNEDQESVMKRLQPRFQIVDHFTQETLAEQAALPASGRSYLYSITPIDFAGNLGRPLTLVATRYPSEPPQVPVDGELIASYRVNQVDFAPLEIDQSIRPPLIVPERVQVTWTDPGARKDGPTVGIAQYRLIFRREATLPIGSYGLDSTTQGSRAKSLPSSNARPLPTDIEVTLVPEGPRGARRADIPLETLQSAGVFPSGEQPTWQPEAWRVYLQTESTNGVPSALAPVQLMLRMEAPPQGEVDLADLLEQREERRPAELEWLPKPTRLPLLPPEDQRAIPGVAHFPMPIKRLDFTITQNTLDKLEPDLNALGLSAQEAAQILTALTEMRDQAFEGQDYFLSAVADALDAFFTESLGNLILSHAERSAYVAPFDGALDNIAYQRHPAGIRCIRFRWNQGPSHLSNYLLDLNAGYHLLELDIDAHTDEIFSDRDKLARALRQIQEVQMLPAEDLSLAPGDTLAPNQWEAWYPSAILRRVEAAERAEGSQIPSGPWYSWRESILVWPTWLDLTDPPHQRKTMLHPLLSWIESALNGSGPIFSQAEDDAAALIDALISGDVALVRSELQARGLAVVPPIAITTIERDRFWQITGQQQIFSVRLEEEDGQSHLNTYWENYNLDLQVSPPFQPMTRETFLTSTAPKTDPYGWGILQRFGLSLTFSLRDAATGELVQGIDLLAAVKTVLDLKAQEPGLKHLHLELLVQPGQSVSLQEDSLAAESMLAMVQLSLRPRPVQMLRYTTMTIRGPAGQAVELVVKQDCSLINQADPAGGQVELDVTADAPGIHPVTLPFNGQTSILLRSANVFDANRLYVRFVPTESLPELLPPTFNLYFASRAAPSPHYAIIKSPSGLTEEERAEIEGILHEDDLGILDLELIFPQEFPVVDERSTYFTAPVDALAESFSHGSTPEGAEWRKFKRYAEALNSADSDADQIIVPLLQTDIEPILTDYLLWAQRFFDAGPDTVPAAEIADQPDGPWLATAYPRAGSPAYAAPDEAGRLQYDHLLEDKWAHTYRYYIRPYGRYDLLWRSFRQSLSLFPGQTTLPEPAVEATPDPDAGGLDVVLDRTHPVQKPLILRSERLDAPGTPGSPTVPGAIWEVIVAQHPEQALIERNQTLARQLAFRQVAFTLLRRFAYGRWLELLQSFKSDLDVTFIENTTAGIPGTYPAQPDHLDMDAPALTEEAVRSIALPERLSNFQQGALALQWDALPFYYEHRLLLIAQTAANVSPINEVVQRDFEYISPDPEATTQGVIGSNDIRARRVDIPLKRLWDSLPPLAQAQWPDEDPDAAAETNGALRPGALPDPEVVYQIIEFSRGNVEVQAELFFDFNGEAPDYSVRQLGQRFLAAILNPAADPINPWPADDVLRVKLSQFTEEPLSQSYDVPDALQHKIKFRVHILVIEGVLTTTDLELLKTTITNPQDQASLDRIHQGWYSQEPISSLPPDSLQPPLQTLVDYPEVNECTLVWVGPVTDAEQEAILALPGDDPFQVALQRLAGAAQDAAQDAVIVEVAPLGPEQRPPDVPADLTFAVDETTGAISWTGLADEATLELLADGTTYTTLCWIGLLYDEEKNRVEPILRQWAQAPALLAALEALFEALEQRPFTRSLPGRPTQEDLPGLLRPKLLIGPDILSWTGPLPSDAERAALNSLTTEPQTDAHFKAAVTSLLNLIDADAQVPLAEEAVPPETLPEEIAGQLIVQETDGIQPLTWRGPAPNDVQQAILNEPGSFSTDQLFIEAVMALVELLNAPKETSLPSLVRPPDQPIPDSLQDNLTIEVDQVVWKGRPAAAAQLTDLASFADAIAAGDPDLKIALDAIANDLRTVPVDVALSIPIRPQPGQLPDSLIDRLLIGRAALRYHGLMTLDEGHTLQALFDLLPDRAAIQRLLASSMGKGMRDRELRIRARRGSATPSAMKPLADEKL